MKLVLLSKETFMRKRLCKLAVIGLAASVPVILLGGLLLRNFHAVHTFLGYDCDFSRIEQTDAEPKKIEVLSLRDGTLTTKDTLDITELLVKQMLEDNNRKDVCFISMGREEGTVQDGPWKEPPHELLARFITDKYAVKPSSQMQYNDGAVRDAATGQYGCVYFVLIRGQTPDGDIVADAVAERGGLAAHGHSAVLRKTEGTWRVVYEFDFWIS